MWAMGVTEVFVYCLVGWFGFCSLGSGIGLVSAVVLFFAFLIVSVVIDGTAKEASLAVAAGMSTDRGLPRGFWQQQG